MSFDALVSVIIPIYNSQKYLKRCLDSVLNQSYKNFELILVDDGSTDESAKICKKFVSHDGRVKLFVQKNGGVTSARRKGWLEATGDWIMFVDSDDTVTPTCLAVLLKAALTSESDIVNACFRSTSDNRPWTHKKLGLMQRGEYLEAFARNQIYGTLYASLYKRSLFQHSTFKFDSTIKIGEDVLCCMELGLRVDKVLNISDVVYNYYDNQDSVMNQKAVHPSYLERYFSVTDELLQDAGIADAVVLERRMDHNSKLLKTFFSPYIPFDSQYYLRLRSYIAQEEKEALSKCNKIYCLAMRQTILAKLIKSLYKSSFLIIAALKGKKNYKKEIVR